MQDYMSEYIISLMAFPLLPRAAKFCAFWTLQLQLLEDLWDPGCLHALQTKALALQQRYRSIYDQNEEEIVPLHCQKAKGNRSRRALWRCRWLAQ